ncbi:uncharacterized protein LOC127845462 isoform X1 [Dreissena polymorpha]|nr:uncharacterized protein LOC127845462 isoform X1 [Dreissena polymorpha]
MDINMSEMAEGGYWHDESGPEYVIRRSGIYSQHSQVQWENASVEMCNVMTWLGFGPHIRKARRDFYMENNMLLNAQHLGKVKMITTGSKAEGLTCLYESDVDNMYVKEDVMCLEDGLSGDMLPKETTLFTLNTGSCYHGHCWLLLKRRGTALYQTLSNALCDDENGRSFLNSDVYVTVLNSTTPTSDEVRHSRAGPSMPTSIGAYHQDRVLSFACDCPSILQKWAERRRNWPAPDIVQKVVSLRAFVTPVGYKGSENRAVEWRIGFNTGENELVSSLNSTQVYIYVILKMVVKDILKPIKKEITSYTVKNLVFWLAENNHQELFTERNLFHWLCEGLKELRTALSTTKLSYYMIPERNLMDSCGMNEKQQRTWVAIINELMNEGPLLVLKLPKIRQAIVSHPVSLFWYGQRRFELELLMLKCMNRLEQCKAADGISNTSDSMLNSILTRIDQIVREVRQRMIEEGSCVNELMEIHNRILM